jgi:anti-anti-sigma factor
MANQRRAGGTHDATGLTAGLVACAASALFSPAPGARKRKHKGDGHVGDQHRRSQARAPQARTGGAGVSQTTCARLDVTVVRVGRRAVVRAAGEIDAATAPLLGRALDEAERGGALEVWLDLGPTEFMDSTGLTLVLRARQRLAGLRRRLTIVCPRGPVRRVFELAELDRALSLYGTLSAAQRGA